MQGLEADHLRQVVLNDDGSRTRIIFQQGGNDFYLEADTAQLRLLMPILAQVTNPKGPEVTTILVTDVEAWLDHAGQFLLTLTGTAGAKMTFGLSLPQVVELSALADEALQSQSGTSEIH